MGFDFGGLLGGLGSAGSAAASIALQKDAQKFAKKMYRHRYQYQMKDMREAGLNPILSYSQSPPGGPSVGIASMPDMGQSITAGMQRGASAKESKAKTTRVPYEKRLIDQQIATSAATANKENQQANLNRANTNLVQLQMPEHIAKGAAWQSDKGPGLALGQLAPTGAVRQAVSAWDTFSGQSIKKMRDFWKRGRTGPDLRHTGELHRKRGR